MTAPSKSADLPRGLIDRKGTPAGRNTRLPSIRGPRDLTLGGIPKKVFMPNIPSRRSKDESASTSPKSEPKQGHRRERSSRHERERGRGRGRNRDNVVQSHSIFEQGPSGDILSRSKLPSYPSSNIADNSSGTKVYKSNINKKESKEDTKRLLDRLLQDDFVEPCSPEELSMQPVQLPLSSRLMVKKEEEEEEEEEQKPAIIPVVKTEPMDESVPSTPPAAVEIETKPPPSFPRHYMHTDVDDHKTCEQLFSKCAKSEIGELIFLQLPDVLPGIPPNQEDNKPKIKTEPGVQASNPNGNNPQSTPDDETILTERLNICSLKDFSEGYVGKLQTRKSGKAQLLLGNITLDVSMGTPCGFLQDLVSVKVSGKEGDLTVLGHVTHRLICTPNFDSLVKSS